MTASSATSKGKASDFSDAERAALLSPPTVVTSKNFEQLVLQSQLAICLTYHVDSTRSRQFLPRIEEAVGEMNVRARTRWLSLMTIDADRNPTLAGAFSVERAKLPITFFVYAGTIVDKINGAVPKERLGAILRRFMEYYQEQKGVELEDHGFMHGAKQESLAGALSTQEYEGKLDWLLLSKERAWAQPPTDARALATKAAEQAAKDLRELQDQVGMNFKKISDEELQERYYSKPAYAAAARIAFLSALIDIIDTTTVPNAAEASKALKKALDEHRNGMMRPAVRYAACVAQLRLAERGARELMQAAMADAQKTLAVSSGSDPSIAQQCLLALNDVLRWVNLVDVPGGLDGEFPQGAVDEMLTKYRQLTVLCRKSQQQQQHQQDGSSSSSVSPKAVQALVGDCIRGTLQLFNDHAKCSAARARFSALLH